jgi:hypothetical protein
VIFSDFGEITKTFTAKSGDCKVWASPAQEEQILAAGFMVEWKNIIRLSEVADNGMVLAPAFARLGFPLNTVLVAKEEQL